MTPAVQRPSYWLLPHHLVAGMRRYIEERIRPGGFLMAVLSNDLADAFARADDLNILRMQDVVAFLHTTPPGSWGSAAIVEAWLAGPTEVAV